MKKSVSKQLPLANQMPVKKESPLKVFKVKFGNQSIVNEIGVLAKDGLNAFYKAQKQGRSKLNKNGYVQEVWEKQGETFIKIFSKLGSSKDHTHNVWTDDDLNARFHYRERELSVLQDIKKKQLKENMRKTFGRC